MQNILVKFGSCRFAFHDWAPPAIVLHHPSGTAAPWRILHLRLQLRVLLWTVHVQWYYMVLESTKLNTQATPSRCEHGHYQCHQCHNIKLVSAAFLDPGPEKTLRSGTWFLFNAWKRVNLAKTGSCTRWVKGTVDPLAVSRNATHGSLVAFVQRREASPKVFFFKQV